MIERSRMKTDMIGQTVQILSIALTGFSNLPRAWFIILFAILGVWQGASALHLALAYEYQARYPFLWLFSGLLLALPLGIWLMGDWVMAPLGLGLLAYFIVTVRDTAYVLQRPRPFWDL